MTLGVRPAVRWPEFHKEESAWPQRGRRGASQEAQPVGDGPAGRGQRSRDRQRRQTRKHVQDTQEAGDDEGCSLGGPEFLAGCPRWRIRTQTWGVRQRHDTCLELRGESWLQTRVWASSTTLETAETSATPWVLPEGTSVQPPAP